MAGFGLPNVARAHIDGGLNLIAGRAPSLDTLATDSAVAATMPDSEIAPPSPPPSPPDPRHIAAVFVRSAEGSRSIGEVP